MIAGFDFLNRPRDHVALKGPEMPRVCDGLTFNGLGAENGSHRDNDAHKARVRDGHSSDEALVAVMQAANLRKRNHLAQPHHRSRLGAVFGK